MTNQEAIELLKKNKPTSDTRECGKELCEAVDAAIEALQKSKIIMCKDCKYYCANYCTRDIKGRTNMFYMKDDAFCSEEIMAGEQ